MTLKYIAKMTRTDAMVAERGIWLRGANRRQPSRSRVVWYDMIWWTILTCAQKLTRSQLSLPHGTKQKRIMKKLKTWNGDAQKKRSSREVRGVSPEAGRESMGGRFVERVGLESGVKERGSYGWWEWCVVAIRSPFCGATPSYCA